MLMQYLMLYYSDPTGPTGGDGEMEAWFAMAAEMTEAKVSVDGAPLHPADTATTVRIRDGKTVPTDGPFAETKEVLGGYDLIEVANLDEAIAWAAKAPVAQYGSVEVRPVMDLATLR
ncbi:MAG: YciI family protein [Acidimicrobiales bacterium]